MEHGGIAVQSVPDYGTGDTPRQCRLPEQPVQHAWGHRAAERWTAYQQKFGESGTSAPIDHAIDVLIIGLVVP